MIIANHKKQQKSQLQGDGVGGGVVEWGGLRFAVEKRLKKTNSQKPKLRGIETW